MYTNNKIESGLLEKALAEGLAELARTSPALLDIPQSNQELIKMVYRLAFVSGTAYGVSRAKQLTCGV